MNKSLDQIQLKEEKKKESLGEKMPLNLKSKSTLSLSEVKVKKSKKNQNSGKKTKAVDNEVMVSDEEEINIGASKEQENEIKNQWQEVEVNNIESKSNNQDDAGEADNSAEDSQDNNVPQNVKWPIEKKKKYFRKKTYTNINSSSIDDGLLESLNH